MADQADKADAQEREGGGFRDVGWRRPESASISMFPQKEIKSPVGVEAVPNNEAVSPGGAALRPAGEFSAGSSSYLISKVSTDR